MNILQKLFWRWQGRRKIDHNDVGVQYTAIRKLGEVANKNDFDELCTLLSDTSQVVRNATSQAVKNIIEKEEEDEVRLALEDKLVNQFYNSNSLIEKLALVEAMGTMKLETREEILGPLVTTSENDLQYVIIGSLKDTSNEEILDDILDAADTSDIVLRRIALQTWYEGIARHGKDMLDYCTPRLHYLIRASYQLQTDGELLRTILSYSDRNKLPHPKAYPDFMIRYVTELLGKWEYDPEAYRSLHAIMVPSYFTFDEKAGEEDRPYVIL